MLIDEFGTGTDPELGGAIAESILEELSANKTLGIITTHYMNIKLAAERLDGVENACMLFDDETLMQTLCDVRGIGRWTAEMFLIFHLHRPDVWPVQDIGLIRAIERHYLGGQKASKAHIEETGDRWRPWRTVATWYLWRSLDPFPVEY